MIDLITNAQAQEAVAASAKQPSLFSSLAPLLLIFAVFYFFIIRPQQTKLQAHRDLLGSLKKGDKVVTNGGIIGSVIKVDDVKNLLSVEIADQVHVKIRKDAVTEVLTNEAA